MTDDVERVLADLPGFDCGCCELTCREMAEQIVAGRASLADCKTLEEDALELTVNGRRVELTEFPRGFLARTVLGAVSALKGVGDVETLQLRIVNRRKSL